MVSRALERPLSQSISILPFLTDDLNFINSDLLLWIRGSKSEVISCSEPHQGPSVNIWWHFSLSQLGVVLLLASSVQRPGVLLSIPQLTGQTPTENYSAPNTNSFEVEKSCFGLHTHCLSSGSHLKIEEGQEDEKTNHRLGGNICKKHLRKDCNPKYTKTKPKPKSKQNLF